MLRAVRSSAGVLLLGLLGVVTVPSAGATAAESSSGPTPGVVYDSAGREHDVQNLYLAAPANRDSPGIVRFFIATDCGGGDLAANVTADGTMHGRGQIFDTDNHDREIVLDVRIKGELGPRGGSGSWRVSRTKGPECAHQRDWTITRERTEPDLRRLEAVIPSPNPDYDPALATNGTGVYMLVPSRSGEQGHSTIAEIDPSTNAVVWKRDVAFLVDDLAATDDALWLLQRPGPAVARFDLGTREVSARIPLGDAGEPARDAPAPTVVAHDGVVWATGASGVITRIDALTSRVVASFETGAPVAEMAAGPAGLYAEIVLPPDGEASPETRDLPRPLRRTGSSKNTEHSRIVRLDPETGAVQAEIVTTALWDLEIGPDGLYTSEGIRAIVRRDPATLAELVRGDYLAKAIGIAAPGVWLSGFDTAAVRGDTLLQQADLVDIGTSFSRGLVTGFDAVWISEWGGVTRVRAGDAAP
jgi:hypothetical protein